MFIPLRPICATCPTPESAMKDGENFPDNKYKKVCCLGIKSNAKHTKAVSITSNQDIITKLIQKQEMYKQIKRISEIKTDRIKLSLAVQK
jgi:activator of 2-hydroxyglutaryl-CoA dehydratase